MHINREGEGLAPPLTPICEPQISEKKKVYPITFLLSDAFFDPIDDQCQKYTNERKSATKSKAKKKTTHFHERRLTAFGFIGGMGRRQREPIPGPESAVTFTPIPVTKAIRKKFSDFSHNPDLTQKLTSKVT